MPAADSPKASIHPAVALHAALLKHLLAKGILSVEEIGQILNGAIETAADHPEADAVRAIFQGVVPQD